MEWQLADLFLEAENKHLQLFHLGNTKWKIYGGFFSSIRNFSTSARSRKKKNKQALTQGARCSWRAKTDKPLPEDNSENADEMVDVQSQLIVSTDRIATLVPDSRKYKEESINFNKLQARKIQLELDGETVGEQAIAVRIYNLRKTKALLDLATAEETAGLARKTALGG